MGFGTWDGIWDMGYGMRFGIWDMGWDLGLGWDYDKWDGMGWDLGWDLALWDLGFSHSQQYGRQVYAPRKKRKISAFNIFQSVWWEKNKTNGIYLNNFYCNFNIYLFF